MEIEARTRNTFHFVIAQDPNVEVQFTGLLDLEFQNKQSKRDYIKINLKNNCKIIYIDLNCVNCFNKYNNYLDDHFESYW